MPDGEVAGVVAALAQHGIDEATARRLAHDHGVERCREQMRRLRYRPAPPTGTRTGQLLRSIEQSWGLPEGYAEAIEREKAAQRRAERAAAEAAEAERRAATAAALDRLWEELDASEQARLDARVAELLVRECPDRQLFARLPHAVQEALRKELRREALAAVLDPSVLEAISHQRSAVSPNGTARS